MRSLVVGAVVAAILAWTNLAGATEVVVNQDRPCPGAGTPTSPYCSIQQGLMAAVPGTRIRIQRTRSAYAESVIASVPGTAMAPIIVEADDRSDPPTITGSFTLQNVGYWTIRNLLFDGAGATVPTSAIIVRGDPWVHDGSEVVGVTLIDNTFRNWGMGNRPPELDPENETVG